MKTNRLSNLMLVLSCAAFAACASVEKADIPSSANPQEEITKLDHDLNQAVSKNIDVLASSEFYHAVKKNREAKSDLANDYKQEDVLDDLRIARGWLNKAYSVSENREAKAPSLFEARQIALAAGAGARPELRKALNDVDADVADKADDLGNVSTADLSKLQDRYIDLERRAVILAQLGNAQAIINGARVDGALKKAPDTFKKADMSLRNAQSVVSTNVRSPEGYKDAVAEANSDAALLADVIYAIRHNKLSESAALEMVAQNRQIGSLKSDLEASSSAHAATQEELAAKDAALAAKNKDLSAAQAAINLQAALEKARSEFSPDEAEAYQQGDSLLIRLKKMDFASGRSDLPSESLASLAKVSDVAKGLDAAVIKVEGNTDSTGSAALNHKLSEKRASAVATYFKENGFGKIDIESTGNGFQKPIASNKTKAGRAQNRRVDIVITPKPATDAAAPSAGE